MNKLCRHFHRKSVFVTLIRLLVTDLCGITHFESRLFRLLQGAGNEVLGGRFSRVDLPIYSLATFTSKSTPEGARRT